MNVKESLTTTYDSAKSIIKNDLASMSKKFITIGYYLKYIRDNEMYTQDGFTSIWEFAQETYGISKSTCSRWMSMNDKFSKGGNSPYLREEFANFGKSQLQEMLYLDDTQIEKATPEMTAKEIRQLKEPEEIPGQMEIQDYPEVIPEEKIPYFAFDGEPYGWTWSEVVKAYLKNGYKKPESGTEVKCLGKMYLILRRKEKTFFYDSQGSTLFEVDNERLEKEFEFMQDANTANTAAEPKETLQEVQQDVNEEESQTILVAPAQQAEGYEKYEEVTEKTDIEILKEELEKAKRYLIMAREEFTEKDIRVRRQKLLVGALAGMLSEIDNEIPEPVQPPLPEMKNNDQRKEWLNNYRSWGIWYKDEHTGATYYRYQFENGADLIAEEYELESQYTESYLHLIGGPEPPRKNGIPKWAMNEKYNRYPNSETELVEFLKELQKGKRQ